MILKLSNKENTYTFTVDDLNNGEKLYYKFQIPASDVVDGKYNMVLMDDDGNIITEEQVCMGYFNAETIQYNRGENVYINSPLNANLEDVRTITIDVPNYTIYPSEGYDAMKEVVVDAQPVYDNGYNEGEIAQKAKLTGITITENGTYSREDGYNEITVDVPDLNGDYNEGYDAGKVEGYDSGYTAGIDYAIENAGEIIAQTARVLDVTENGFYETQYSEPRVLTPITGKYPNGDNFYDYAYISKRGYNTGIFPGPTTRLEFWWKFDGTIEEGAYGEGLIIGSHNWGQVDSIFKVGFGFNNKTMVAAIGSSETIEFAIPDKEWHHYTMSYKDGFFIDGEKISNFGEGNLTETSTYEPICINGYYGSSRINADDFGMVIVDDTIFIPTVDGFMNYTTNEYLPIVRNNDGSYTYTQVEPEYSTPTGNLIKTVNVNVQPKISVAKYGIKLSQSKFTKIPEMFDFSNVGDMSNMFQSCSSLRTIPLIDTSNVINMNGMFAYCSSLQSIPELNTSNVINMESMFQECKILQTIPLIDTSNVTSMNSMFYNCVNLINVPPLNAEKLNMSGSYQGLFMYFELPKLTDFGGLIGLKYSLTGDYTFPKLPNLTYQSCINILNGLYDFTGNGETPTSSEGQLKVHPNFLTTVGDEINIGINKGWTITA